MASLCESLISQLARLVDELHTKVAHFALLKKDDRSAANRIERLANECEELVEQIELEARECAEPQRSKCTRRLRELKTQFDSHKLEYRNAKTAIENDAAQYGDDDDDEVEFELNGRDSDKRRLLASAGESLQRGGAHIDSSMSMVVETEEIGTQILTDLHTQRETIQRSRMRLRNMDDQLGKSSRLLNTMVQRIMQNRLVLLFILLVVLGVIAFSLYMIFRPK